MYKAKHLVHASLILFRFLGFSFRLYDVGNLFDILHHPQEGFGLPRPKTDEPKLTQNIFQRFFCNYYFLVVIVIFRLLNHLLYCNHSVSAVVKKKTKSFILQQYPQQTSTMVKHWGLWDMQIELRISSTDQLSMR